jgi:site-specific DNA-methyltransferase (adenine-specific)/adenine-specific DNA-methyltransferase
LLGVSKELNEQIQDETKYTGFEVYNVNQYDIFRNELEAKELLKEALEIQPLPANNVYDGEKDGRMVKIMPVNRIATRADLNELITNFDYKRFEKRQSESLNTAVESLLLICMGHEPDLAAHLQKEVPYKLDIEVVDILRDKSNLEFKRDSEAEIKVDGNKLIIEQFYPMNLLQKLSIMKENVKDWKEMVESVMIDFNYDGAIFTPTIVDVPNKKELVKGVYSIPSDSGTIKVKITDLLSESLEIEIV